MSKSQVDELLESYSDNSQESSPIIIVKKGNLNLQLSEESIRNYSIEVLNYMMDDIRKRPDFAKNYGVLKALTELKKTWWPAVQKQVHTNIDLFNEELKLWYLMNEEKKKIQQQNIITVTYESNDKQAKLEV